MHHRRWHLIRKTRGGGGTQCGSAQAVQICLLHMVGDMRNTMGQEWTMQYDGCTAKAHNGSGVCHHVLWDDPHVLGDDPLCASAVSGLWMQPQLAPW